MTARPLARIALPLLAVAALGSTAACGVLSEPTTLTPYAAADGVNARSGDLSALNLGVVTRGEGEAGVVTGALVNRGAEADTVSVIVEGMADPVQIQVPARGTVTLGPEEGQETVEIPTVTKAPGTTLTMLISSARVGELRSTVPLLAATGPFATVTSTRPPSKAPTPTPSETPTEDSGGGDAH